MLRALRLSNFGVVREAELEFEPGLTALTGETGAGKTMLVAGLGMLLGARGDSGVVRRGSDRARVEGRWLTDEDTAGKILALGGDLDDGDELVTMRQINAQGRTRATAGGVQVPVATLAAVASELATIHGQSEQIRLSSPERQRQILDAFAKPADLEQYRDHYREHRELARELDQLVREERDRAREIDLLQFGLREIDAAQPQPGEDEQLAAESVRLQDADELKQLAASLQTALSGDEYDFDQPNVLALLGEARKQAATLAGRDATAGELAGRIAEAAHLLGDIAGEVAGYAADLVSDPLRLEAVQQRRSELAGLQRKYGPELADVIAWAEEARTTLLNLEGADERIGSLRVRVAELDQQIRDAAVRIHNARREAAEGLTAVVAQELAALAMPHARLVFEITPTDHGPHGADRVELMFTANPGATPAPLGKVASGGELSRVRLALEVVLASDVEGHTYVFDEVDAGVGGAVGLEIGRRLKRLAVKSQVIVVTHLAQVAAFADHQFVVSKHSDGQVTTSGIRQVTGEQRVAEISRMMSGDPESVAGAEHAAELIETASRG